MSYVRSNHDFSNVTLTVDDLELLPAHRVFISAGSKLFETILRKTGGHPHPTLDSFLALARDIGVRTGGSLSKIELELHR